MSDYRMYRFLSLAKVKSWEPLARRWGVSLIARSPAGFLTAYKKAGGKSANLSSYWHQRRAGFIARHMAQARREPLWRPDGLPTRRHLALIMWAYSPEARKL